MAAPSRHLWAGLVDDAALFPPGNAPLGRALAEHATHRASAYGDLVGPFLCPATRVDELTAALPSDQHLDLAIVFDVTGEGAHHAWRSAVTDPRVRLVAVEAAHAALGEAAAAVGANVGRSEGVTGFLEVPRTGFEASLDLVASSGWDAAKYRTGGVTADAFPTEDELAAFLAEVAARGLPFKLTAGLHRAARTTSPEGFEQHGVLNVLVATRVAREGGSVGELVTALAERRADRLVAFVRDWDEDACAGVRRALRSFGCCGVTDPIDDLRALGLLGAG